MSLFINDFFRLNFHFLQVELTEKDENPPGLILSNGDINWNCPCLGGMAVGPCGVEFREAFSCFHYSEADPKGSDCIEKFSEMQKCMQSYPELFEERKPDKEEAPPENEEKAPSGSDSAAKVEVDEAGEKALTSEPK